MKEKHSLVLINLKRFVFSRPVAFNNLFIFFISIPISAVNDGICDCADGSDEPGTSACSNGRFWCNNLNTNGYYIPSSSVDDGIIGLNILNISFNIYIIIIIL